MVTTGLCVELTFTLDIGVCKKPNGETNLTGHILFYLTSPPVSPRGTPAVSLVPGRSVAAIRQCQGLVSSTAAAQPERGASGG